MKFVRLAMLAIGVAAVGPGPARGEETPVGVAQVDITPAFPVRLHGYASRAEESKGVQLRLRAKALAFGGDEQGPSVLITVDGLGVPDAVAEALMKRLAGKANIKRERLAIGASHTHSAPMLSGVAPNIFGKPIPGEHQAHIDQYTRQLIDQLEALVLAALADRKPALVSWGEGKVGFAVNRRVSRTAGQVAFGENPKAPVDHALPVLRVTDPSGGIRAILVNYACHCTTLDPADNLISSDWAGYAQEAIEADHPGCIALTLIGCGADANPAQRTSLEVCKKHGRSLADEVNRVIAGSLTALSGPPVTRFRSVSLPLDTLPTRAQLEALVKAGSYPGYNAQTQLAKLDRGGKLEEAFPYPIQTWQFGDKLMMVFLAGEVVVDYALRLKQELDPKRLWVTAYANDAPCYIASERILQEGGYEGGGAMVFYAKPTRLKPGVEDIIINTVRALVPPEFTAKPPPKAEKTSRVDAPQVDNPDEMPAPLSPREALAAFRTKPGLKVELVASEPLVIDPVAVDFGADGKLWVCEMHDYPAGIKGDYEPGGRIKVLEDTDHDGRFDRGTIYLDKLAFPTGVMCWRKGVLICAAPDIIYAEDTNGDGKADIRKVLYHGFATENYQARVNGLSYGLDNWVYGANGLIGGRIEGTISGKTVEIGGRDFRINPDTGAMQPASGLTQQGRSHDDSGNQFGGNNSVLLQHYPFPDHDAARNPSVTMPSPAVYVPRNPDSNRVYPASRTLARFNHPESANTITSACSPEIYRDVLLGKDFLGNAFICEPVHNLVTRQVLRPAGVTFAGRRAADEQESEFLASTDNWCRPVQVRTGPDGALWVVDMYRFVIEHPRWISPDRLEKLDVRAGADRGRIYRIVPESATAARLPDLDSLSTAELAARLDTSNGTLRDLIQRLLAHRADRAAVPVLTRLATASERPEVRMQALCTLDALGPVPAALIQTLMADAHPSVRHHAVRLSRLLLTEHPELARSIAKLIDDPSAFVRFQVALSLGDWDHVDAGHALGRLALANQDDTWLRAAVLSSASKQSGAILRTVLATVLEAPDRANRSSLELAGPLIATIADAGSQADLDAVMKVVDIRDGKLIEWKLGALADLLDAVDRGRRAERPVLDPRRFEAAFSLARKRVQEGQGDRALAVRLLGRDPAALETDLGLLRECLDTNAAGAVQAAAVQRLSRLRDDRAAGVLVASWGTMLPSTRGAVLDALAARASWALVLLEQGMKSGGIAVSEIDATHRQQLLKHADANVRKQAEAAFSVSEQSTRQAVLAQFDSVKARTGNAGRGAAVFEKLCAGCHQLAGRGHVVGPDLEALTDTTSEALMLAVLDPNRDVDARYAAYTAALHDGRVLTGLIGSETGSSITLKQQDGREDVLLRGEIEALKGSGQSLMPEGLERDLNPDSLADLIAYVASGGSPPKSFAGNQPKLVTPSPTGVVRLDASTAAIRGDTLIFEPEHHNLGYWHSANDRARWTFETAKPGTYTVTMEWACPEESAGQSYVIKVGDRVFQGVVGDTGTAGWEHYRSIFLFEVVLPEGRHALEMKPAGAPKSALLDLRAVLLSPRIRLEREPHP